jgi:hypothetical protein
MQCCIPIGLLGLFAHIDEASHTIQLNVFFVCGEERTSHLQLAKFNTLKTYR